MTSKALAADFAALAQKAGAVVHRACLLGRYLHIDTNKASEPVLLQILGSMKASRIVVLPKAADGVHLDGSRHHRIVAVI